jgi:RNA polymerase primary sigma factor
MKKPRKTLSVPGSEGTILDLYLKDVSREKLLSPAEERALAERSQAGDELAIDELVTRNLRFVISIAKRYQHRGLSLMDLIGEGNFGLLVAARKFDPARGVKFISYAVWWIRQAILAALARHGRQVRLPLHRTADLARIIRASDSLSQALGRVPTAEELSEAVELPVDVVQSLAALNVAEVRLDAPAARGDGADRAALDRFMVEEQGDAEENVFEQFLVAEVDSALGTLPAREARILRLYFGLGGLGEHTLEEIGDLFGITRERVRQLRDRALRRLREGPRAAALASFAA